LHWRRTGPQLFSHEHETFSGGPSGGEYKTVFLPKMKIIPNAPRAPCGNVLSSRKQKLFSGGSDARRKFRFPRENESLLGAELRSKHFPGEHKNYFRAALAQPFSLGKQ
jgi:hypothetical protein